MTYKNYHEIISDFEYYEELVLKTEEGAPRRHFDREILIDLSKVTINRIKKTWYRRIEEKYFQTAKTNSILGKFLAKYKLSLKEFRILIELLDDVGSSREIFFIKETSEDIFQKYKVRYESSSLKKNKLIFKIINPLTPVKAAYEVSYQAQLALKGKKYTEEYEQLDLALEEDSKRNSPDALDSLYYITEPKFTFKNLIIDDKTKQSLLAAIAREQQKDKIFKEWGLNKVIEYGRGTTLNFRGPPGTGKTLAAMCLANELKKKLLIVRYDQLQSCWIGETEKHIQRIFKLAQIKKAVLFFDEADAIATKRSEFSLSWEMSQVNTLLKELERFEGMCIFATNFAEKYDPAFQRRLTMHIDFKIPMKDHARLILNQVLPKKARDENLSLETLNLEGFSGGDIKNIALNAAGFAARDNSKKIMSKHLEEAINLVKNSKLISNRKFLPSNETNYLT